MAWIETKTGVALPAPTLGNGTVSIATMVDGGRSTANGCFVGSVIGDDKLTIDCTFEHLTPEELQRLLCIFDRQQGGRFINDFRVYDPRVQDFVVKTMYVGDRSATPYAVSPQTFRPGYWKGCKVKLVEV